MTIEGSYYEVYEHADAYSKIGVEANTFFENLEKNPVSEVVIATTVRKRVKKVSGDALYDPKTPRS